MTSRTTKQFRSLLARLPKSVRKQARKAYQLFKNDPNHPGLRFKKVNDDPVYNSARVGIGYRAPAAMKGDDVVWFWIGSHADYDALLAQL